MPTITLTTTANDDGIENVGTGVIDRSGSAMWFGNHTYQSNAMLRFALPSTGWLVNKTIEAMSLSFTVNGGTDSSSFKQKIYLELAASPSQCSTTGFSISSRTRASTALNGDQFGGSTLVNWNTATTVTYSATATGASLASMLTSMLVDAAALGSPFTASSVAALNFIFMFDATGSSGQRIFNASEFGSGAPTLSITYSEPSNIWDKTVVVVRNDSKVLVV